MSQFNSAIPARKPTSIILGSWLLALLCCPLASSKTQTENAIEFPVETREYTLTVVDEDGKPIAGAAVEAAGVRCQEHPGSWYGWPAINIGKTNRLFSDATGKITVRYPVKYGRPPEWLTTTTIDFRFKHPLYVANSIEVDPREEGIEHVMISGCEVLLSAVDDAGLPIDRFGVAMAGPGGQADWISKDGTISTRSIPDGPWQTMLVAPGPAGVHMFSGILPAKFARDRPVTIRGIKLSPGLQLSGELDPQVQRPVIEGRVIAYCLPKPSGEVHDRSDPSLSWTDGTEINQDGSFTFKSLPRTGMVQLIALCRGWTIESQSRDRVGDSFVQGIQVDLDESEIIDGQLTVVLPMQPAGSLEVTVTKPDGSPLKGARVGAWPNQKLDKSGAQLLGDYYPSIMLVEAMLDGRSILLDEFSLGQRESSRFVQTTDENGRVTLYDIPVRRSAYQLIATHPQYNFSARAGTLEEKGDENKGGLISFKFEMATADHKLIELSGVPIPKN